MDPSTAQGIATLFEFLKKLESVKLHLNYNSIGPSGIRSIA